VTRERLSMRKIREVLRQRALGQSLRQIAGSLNVGRSTICEYFRRAEAAGISWPLPDEMDDEALERALFYDAPSLQSRYPLPDFTQVHAELKRKHVTLALLWQEYKEQHPDGYGYSRFCELYHRWAKTLKLWMRQEHKAGEKLFVDYAGDGIPMIDEVTGEWREARLFVAVLGASNFTYAEPTETEQLPEWISCQVNAFHFFEGVPALVVPDQPRTVVRIPCRYDPAIQATFEDMARHFGTCVLPARPRRPKDKAKVEQGVLLAERWIIARLRNRRLVGIRAVKEAVRELLPQLNDRPMRKLNKSRRQLFEEIERAALRPLPERPYEYSEWKIGASVNVDYHIAFNKHLYSVPYQHIHKKVDVRATAATIEVFLNHNRIASHIRSYVPHRFTTIPEHMPKSHREHLEWTPSRIVNWGKKIGPSTALLIERILEERPHPEQGFRACLGIIRLEKRYTRERLERACFRALRCKSHSYRSVESILKNKLEDKSLPERSAKALPSHQNIRGNQYYKTEESK
jgi:transposase